MTALCWPFSTKDESQFRRVDQGWDLQAPLETTIVAVADGTIMFAHDPAGFGDPYPVLVLDEPDPHGRAVYYGHLRSAQREGARVRQGDRLGETSPHPQGNAADLPGWLEVGWWNDGPTGDGQAMHDALIDAPVFGGAATTTTTTSGAFNPMPPTIQHGSSGQAVKNLQGLLNAHGASLALDGQFGDETATQVHNFQAITGLATDGVVGPKTWQLLLTVGV